MKSFIFSLLPLFLFGCISTVTKNNPLEYDQRLMENVQVTGMAVDQDKDGSFVFANFKTELLMTGIQVDGLEVVLVRGLGSTVKLNGLNVQDTF